MHTTAVIWNPKYSIKAQGIRSQLTNTAGDTPISRLYLFGLKFQLISFLQRIFYLVGQGAQSFLGGFGDFLEGAGLGYDVISQVQGGHDGYTFSSEHLAAAADLTHALIQVAGGGEYIIFFPGLAGNAVFLAQDVDTHWLDWIVHVLASSDFKRVIMASTRVLALLFFFNSSAFSCCRAS